MLVGLSEKPFRFLEYLARHSEQLTPTKDLGAYVSSSEYPDAAARRIKGELERQLRAAGIDDLLVDRLVVADGRKGYRLGVSARVV
jgi:hypothetical protein